MKIYTKTGDGGQTSLVSGKRISKAALRIDSYGQIDELNSIIGIIRAEMAQESSVRWEILVDFLENCQHQLFTIGSHLACDDENTAEKLPILQTSFIRKTEALIDQFNDVTPPLNNFILPGGHRIAAQLHFARTVARRAERAIVAVSDEGGTIENEILEVVNRLSDFFFVAARWVNHISQHPDVIWEKPKDGE